MLINEIAAAAAAVVDALLCVCLFVFYLFTKLCIIFNLIYSKCCIFFSFVTRMAWHNVSKSNTRMNSCYYHDFFSCWQTRIQKISMLIDEINVRITWEKKNNFKKWMRNHEWDSNWSKKIKIFFVEELWIYWEFFFILYSLFEYWTRFIDQKSGLVTKMYDFFSLSIDLMFFFLSYDVIGFETKMIILIIVRRSCLSFFLSKHTHTHTAPVWHSTPLFIASNLITKKKTIILE